MSYLLPALLALVLHVAIGFSFVWSQWVEVKDSREMPRHIQAQMYDIKELTTATTQAQAKAKAQDVAPEKTVAPPKQSAVDEQAKKQEQLKRERQAQAKKEREQQKREKQKAREAEKQKLEKALAEKKREAKKQREVEAARKLAAKEKAKQEKEALAKKRKAEEAKKKKAAQALAKKREAEKKRKEQAAREKKIADQKRAEKERARIKALQKQIADEELFAAEQVAAEMATGVGVYIRQLLSRNFTIPSTARNGISATVRIRLLPSGRVVGVDVIKESGNVAFDNAAKQAVLRTESFPKVAQIASASPSYFNKNLRTIAIEFTPDQLRW